MATEVELKLSLPLGKARQLASHPLLTAVPPTRKRVENHYYDTPALDLMHHLVAVRRRRIGGIWLLTVKSAEAALGGLASRSEWERPAHPGEFDFGMVDQRELREQLQKCAPALVPVFATHFVRTAWQVTFGDARIEVALDIGRIEAAGRRTAISEVELELLAGEPAALYAFAEALQTRVSLRLATASKAERGYALFTGTPAQPVKAAPTATEPQVNAVDAFRTMATNCIDHLLRNEAGVRHTVEPEYLHQARVALRRLRACLSLFAPVLPETFLAAYREVWGDFARSLNAARNWDVFVEELLPPLLAAFPDDAGLRRLRTAAVRRQRAARKAVAAAFGDPRFARLTLTFAAALQTLPTADVPTLGEFGRDRLRRRRRHARRLGEQLGQLDSAQLHRLRLSCKKLRYALEFLLPEAGKATLSGLAKMQTAFGEVNDHATALQLLAELNSPSAQAQGWFAGRHEHLVAQLPRVVEPWLRERAPWKRA